MRASTATIIGLAYALGGGIYGRGPVDRSTYPARPSPESEAETVRRAQEKRARKAAARLKAAGR